MGKLHWDIIWKLGCLHTEAQICKLHKIVKQLQAAVFSDDNDKERQVNQMKDIITRSACHQMIDDCVQGLFLLFWGENAEVGLNEDEYETKQMKLRLSINKLN